MTVGGAECHASELLYKFTSLYEKQNSSAIGYEEINGYELAYLSLWSVIEQTIISMDYCSRKQQFLRSILSWQAFLEGTEKREPKELSYPRKSNGSAKLPSDISVIEAQFGSMPEIRAIINTDSKKGSTKWRDKRNAIAHHATRFGKKETFLEYKSKMNEGIAEIQLCLQTHSKATK